MNREPGNGGDDADTDADGPADGAGAGDGGTEELTYADVGVDIAESEAATAALVGAAAGDAGDGDDAEGVGDRDGDGDGVPEGFASLLDIGDRYLGLTTDGVGTKLLVAAAMDDYSTVGIDCIAMNANDIVAAGVRPVAFVDYLAVDAPDDATAAEIGEGLAVGAERAGVRLVGGETAVLPGVIEGLDLAGACVGLAPKDATFPGRAEPGDRLVGWRSSGIHSNGLTLAREAATRGHDYRDPCPFGDYGTIGDALLEPTRIYAGLLGPMRSAGVRGAVHVTGGGWTNLDRLGDRRYVVDAAFEPGPVFDFVRREGTVPDAEMYRTFNMGTGFVAAVPGDAAADLAAETGGRVIGRVEAGSGVAIRGLEL